jgi:hypothetical protein
MAATNLACSVILALIVDTICTKALKLKQCSDASFQSILQGSIGSDSNSFKSQVSEEEEIYRASSEASLKSIEVDEVSRVTLIPNSCLVDKGSIDEAILSVLFKHDVN